MKQVAILFIAWVVVLNVFALVANNRYNLLPDTAYTWINPAYTSPIPSWNILDLHNRWDSYWYLNIASNGYVLNGAGQLSNVAFFPLYPQVIKVGVALTAIDSKIIAWLVSVAFTGLATMYLYRLAKDYHPESDALLVVFLLLIFPTAIFLNAIYTESTFLFLSVASFYYLRKKRYVVSGIFGLLAALTRLSGALLFLPFVIEAWKDRKSPFSLLIPLGTGIFLLFHYLKFGDPLLFFKTEALWGRSFHFNLADFVFVTRPAIVNFGLDSFMTLFALVMTVMAFRTRLSYGIYMIASLIIALGSGSLMSIGRYTLVLFPIFILGGSIKNKIGQYIWIMTSTLLLALYTLQFVNHYWAG